MDLIELLIVKQDGGGSGQGEGAAVVAVWWWGQWAKGGDVIEEGDGASRVHYTKWVYCYSILVLAMDFYFI